MKRVFIGILGRRNVGKSSLINAIANQDIAIVSSQAGTTTDPVKKSIELFGIGTAVLVDTAGIDDEGVLGKMRSKKTKETIKTLDAALVLIANNEFGKYEEEIIADLRAFDVPFLIAYNKSDINPLSSILIDNLKKLNMPIITCSALKKEGIEQLLEQLKKIIPDSAYRKQTLIGDVISQGDSILLVMPQDSEAPEGRLILPQVQLIRDILDNNAVAICLQPEELGVYLHTHTPDLVITDSQVFDMVSKIIPLSIPLTSFSVVLARAKGNFDLYIKGTPFIDKLQDGDIVLMLESCTHPTACEDIGRHKIPNLIRKKTGKNIAFEMISALSPLPDYLEKYAMAIQCGGCMVTDKQISNRIKQVATKNVPVSNYGMTIAYLTNIFNRVVEVFCKNENRKLIL